METGRQTSNLLYLSLLLHENGKCLDSKQCGVNDCMRFHNPMLHKEEVQFGKAMTINRHLSQTILRIVPIIIKAVTEIDTFALCDEASTTTLIDQVVADQIGASGALVLPYRCQWMNKTTKRFDKSKKVTVEIAGDSQDQLGTKCLMPERSRIWTYHGS
jgi:hypothetical protein